MYQVVEFHASVVQTVAEFLFAEWVPADVFRASVARSVEWVPVVGFHASVAQIVAEFLKFSQRVALSNCLCVCEWSAFPYFQSLSFLAGLQEKLPEASRCVRSNPRWKCPICEFDFLEATLLLSPLRFDQWKEFWCDRRWNLYRFVDCQILFCRWRFRWYSTFRFRSQFDRFPSEFE